MSKIKCGGQLDRPSFNYPKLGENITLAEAQAQLVESIRNAVEQIRDSQMMQCTVAGDIRRIRECLERCERREQREKLKAKQEAEGK